MVTLEIVPGIDSLILLSLVAGLLDKSAQQRLASRIDHALAQVMRPARLTVIDRIAALSQPIFDPGFQGLTGAHGPVLGMAFFWHALVLIAGGFGQHIPKGCIHAAMTLAALV